MWVIELGDVVLNNTGGLAMSLWWRGLKSWMMFDACKKIQVIWAYPNESSDLCWRSSHIQISNLNLNSPNQHQRLPTGARDTFVSWAWYVFLFLRFTDIYLQSGYVYETNHKATTIRDNKRGLETYLCLKPWWVLFFFVLFCSNNNFFYKLGYMCVNYDGDNEQTPPPIPTQRGLRCICVLEP